MARQRAATQDNIQPDPLAYLDLIERGADPGLVAEAFAAAYRSGGGHPAISDNRPDPDLELTPTGKLIGYHRATLWEDS